MKRLVRVLPTGEVRKLFETRDRAWGAIPRRASRIEIIETGPDLGRFFVDLSLISQAPLCLAETFLDEEEAKAAEREWIRENWILENVEHERSTDFQEQVHAGCKGLGDALVAR